MTARWLVEITLDDLAARERVVRLAREGQCFGHVAIAAAVKRPDGVVAMITMPTRLVAGEIRERVVEGVRKLTGVGDVMIRVTKAT